MPKSRCPKCCPKQCESCPEQMPMPIDATLPNFESKRDDFNYRRVKECMDKAAFNRSKSQEKKIPRICPNRPDLQEDEQIPLTLPVAVTIMKYWVTDLGYEIEDALYDIKTIWTAPGEDLSRKLCATNRLFIYYLLIMAIYIIQVCFLIDEKLFEGLCKIFSSINERR